MSSSVFGKGSSREGPCVERVETTNYQRAVRSLSILVPLTESASLLIALIVTPRKKKRVPTVTTGDATASHAGQRNTTQCVVNRSRNSESSKTQCPASPVAHTHAPQPSRSEERLARRPTTLQQDAPAAIRLSSTTSVTGRRRYALISNSAGIAAPVHAIVRQLSLTIR